MFLEVLVSLCVVGWAAAAPAAVPDVIPLEKQQPTVIPILSQSEETNANGTYKFSYETGNGIKREETSYDKILPRARSAHNSGSDESDESDEIHVQQGSYSYTAPDGTVISVRYIANENGFQPIGSHIPTAAPPAGKQVDSSSMEKTGRALKPSDSAPSESAPEGKSASTLAEAPPALLSRSEDSDGFGASSSSDLTTLTPTTSFESTNELSSTTEGTVDSKKTLTAAQKESATTVSDGEKTSDATTESVEVKKSVTTIAASEIEATTKGDAESESIEKSTKVAPNYSTTSENVEVTTEAAS